MLLEKNLKLIFRGTVAVVRCGNEKRSFLLCMELIATMDVEFLRIFLLIELNIHRYGEVWFDVFEIKDKKN